MKTIALKYHGRKGWILIFFLYLCPQILIIKKSNGYTNNFDYRRFRARLCTHSYRKLDQGKQGSYRLVDARGLLDPLHGGSNAVSPTHAP